MEIERDALEKKLQEIRGQTEGWVAQAINKPISFFLTRRLIKTSITPNQITAVNLLLAGVAVFFLSRLEYGERVLGGVLMYLSSIIDGCDGEVARLKGLSSKFGAWFDTIADDLSNNLFFTALFIGLHRSTGETLYWNVGWWTILASVGGSLVIYHQLLTGRESANAKDFNPAWRKDFRKRDWFEIIRPVMKRDFFIAVIFVFVVINLRPVVFWLGVGATWAVFGLYVASFLLQISKK